MRNLWLTLFSFTLFLTSCSSNPESNQSKIDIAKSTSIKEPYSKVGETEFSLTSITSNFNAYWTYHDYHVKLYRDFLATDEDGKTISKEDFLRKLTNGKYLPLLIHTKDSTKNYKLEKIPSTILKDVGGVVADYAKAQLGYFKMEGKAIPRFSFKDINGNEYSSNNTKGKIVLFKCWFIRCGACVKEMPELNEMVAKYKNRKDILFISLASDEKKPLQNFLTKNKFDYTVVSDQDNYMRKSLGVEIYPTHYIIDKNGILVKAVQSATETAEVLEKLLSE